MPTTFIRPKHITPKQLDKYLAMGWFRMGQMIFTCHFLFFKTKLYAPLWLRLDLSTYTFRKSLRKLLRQNKKQFTIHIREAIFDDEKNELYLKHKSRFEGFVSESLKDSLLDSTNENVYDTYEAAVYDGKKLIAVSFFDLGTDSIASIMGLFDHDYSKYSLGFFTMLLEVEFALSTGRTLYYPGYVVPGYPNFDYKLRVGEMDAYYAHENRWMPYTQFQAKDLPTEVLKDKLTILKNELSNHGISTKLLYYPLYDKAYTEYNGKTFVNTPLILSFSQGIKEMIFLVVEYDFFTMTYQLILAQRMNEFYSLTTYMFLKPFDKEDTCGDFLMREEILGIYKTTKALSEVIIKYIKLLKS